MIDKAEIEATVALSNKRKDAPENDISTPTKKAKKISEEEKGRLAGKTAARNVCTRQTAEQLSKKNKTEEYIRGYHEGYDNYIVKQPDTVTTQEQQGQIAGTKAARGENKRQTAEQLRKRNKTEEFIIGYHKGYDKYIKNHPDEVQREKQKGRVVGANAASHGFARKTSEQLGKENKTAEYIKGYHESYDKYKSKHDKPIAQDILSAPCEYELFSLYPQAGIHAKYLGGVLPDLPFPASQTPATYQHTHKISFNALTENTNNLLPAKHRLSIQTQALEADFYTKITEAEIHQKPWTFICAGRKENALLPESNQVVLVLTEAEYEEIKFSCPSFVNILVVKKVTSECYDDYDNLGLVSARRLAIFLFAQYYQLNDFLMLDDNIQSVSYMGTENNWNNFYDFMRTELGNKSCVSVQSYSPVSQPKEDGLGSKLFMMNMQAIRAKLTEPEAIFSLFPESKQAAKWGEDYYFQLMLQALLHPEENRGLVPAEKALLLRSRKHRNQFAQSSSDVIAQPFDMPSNIEGYEFVKAGILALNQIIHTNLARYAAEKEKRMSANILAAHAAANCVLRTGDCTIWIEIDDELDFSVQYQQLVQTMEFTPNAHRPYQVEAIKSLCQAQSNSLRYQMATGSGKTRIQCELARIAYHLLNPGEFVVIVTPLINLVNQFYESFISFNQKNSAENAFLVIPNEAVVKISSDTQSASLKLLLMNQTIRRQRGVLIFCEQSFNKLLTADPEFLSSIPLVLLDEYHLYPKNIAVLRHKIEKTPTMVIGFTATPPEKDPLSDEVLYTYTRVQGVKAGYLTAVHAEGLGVEYSKDQLNGLIQGLPYLLAESVHPGYEDKTLQSLKGLIYLPSIAACDKAKAVLAQENINVYAIHSKNNHAQAEIEAFVQAEEPCVIVACDMLRIGFDCPALSWVLIARRASNDYAHTNMIEQMIGRVMRKHVDKQVGYVLAFDEVLQTIIKPSLQEQLIPALSTSYQNQIKFLPKKAAAYITPYVDEGFANDDEVEDMQSEDLNERLGALRGELADEAMFLELSLDDDWEEETVSWQSVTPVFSLAKQRADVVKESTNYITALPRINFN